MFQTSRHRKQETLEPQWAWGHWLYLKPFVYISHIVPTCLELGLYWSLCSCPLPGFYLSVCQVSELFTGASSTAFNSHFSTEVLVSLFNHTKWVHPRIKERKFGKRNENAKKKALGKMTILDVFRNSPQTMFYMPAGTLSYFSNFNAILRFFLSEINHM